MKNLLFAQSGGPTAVINASAAGVISAAQKNGFDRILCAHFGMDGILKEDFFDVTEISAADLELLAKTPASAFGSCRFKLPSRESDPSIYQTIENIFAKHEIRCFVYNGGNDSMDTCCKVASFFRETGFDCRVVGVPKTVDNDLVGTHHCPGYGSAAKFVATNMKEIALDTAVYQKGRVTVCEIMGRDAGWLTAASMLAEPDLIYLPEAPFDLKRFAENCREVFSRKNRCLVALSEGVRDSEGNYIGAVGTKDSFNHTQLGGVASFLAEYLKEKHNLKTRAIEFSLPTRAAGHLQSAADLADAFLCGQSAVQAATDGKSGVMAALATKNGKGVCINTELGGVANEVKTVPNEYITNNGSGIAESFADYVLPLVQGEVPREWLNGMPVYFDINRLKKA